MNIETKSELLLQAESFFLQKDFIQALAVAQAVQQHSKQVNFPLGIFHSKILIGKIYCTQGRYGGDTLYFSKALSTLREAAEMEDEEIEMEHQVDLYLMLSEVYLHLDDLEQAEQFANKSIAASKAKNNISGIIESLLALSKVFIVKNNFTKALELTHEMLPYLEQIDEPLLQAEIYNLRCKIYIKQQDYNQILKYSEEVLEISQAHQDVEKEIIAQSNLAVYYGARLDYKSAIQYFFSSLEKSEAIQFDRQTAQILINLGTIYARLFNPKEAVSKYEAVVEKYDRVLVKTTKTILYNNIGNIYFEEKALGQSKMYFEKTLALADEIQYTEMIALGLAHLAKISCEQEKFEEALEFADRANELLEDMGDVNAKSINLLNFAKLAHHSGDFETAILHLKEGIEISKKVRNEENEIACYRLLSTFFVEKKDFENAFHYKMLYAEKQEDYLKKQRNRQILDQEIKFVTQEKQQQIDALQKENQLQSMLLQKQEEVERANEQLTQANEELKQFAYVASHDLKEPLRMIGSYTQLINRKFAAEVDENTQDYFNYVTDGVKRMNDLLDGLLQYATVGRGAQELKAVNLNDTLIICQSNLRLLIAETQTKIIADELPTILGISSLLSQLFQNLISNAIKFQKKDATPEIVIRCEEKENEYLLSVQDNGIGIKPEYKKRIFVIFQRLHARTDYEGTGIGLAICHKILKRMGGEIWVESEIGEGATFYFTFPKGG